MKSLSVIEPMNLTEVQNVAQLFAQSGLFDDSKQTAQAFVKIMAGREIGLGAFAAMQNIYFVNGRPAYAANAIARGIKNNPKYDYRILELSDKVCRIEFFESGQSVAIEELTMKTAQDAGYDKNRNNSKKETWDKFPRNMLFARCLTNGARFYCPDVFDVPVYVPDELDAQIVDEPMDYDPNTGEVIEGEIVEQPQPATNPTPDTVQSGNAGRNGDGAVDSTANGKTPEIAPQSATEPKTDITDHWWGDKKQRQQFWINNNTAGRNAADVGAMLGIKPSKIDNHDDQSWWDAMTKYANVGEAMAALYVMSKEATPA